MKQETSTMAIATKPTRLGRAGVILITCITGWFVMVLEILGVRMLSPYFGSAVYVVTGSVIGTFLLSLAIGYMLGGRLSGRRDSRRGLGVNIAVAGLWMALLPFITEPVCESIFNLEIDEKWGSLLAALALFATPTVLLGTVSPTIVRWLTRGPDDSGRSAGMVLAASTVSSFAGCVVTAFYLILCSMRLTLWISGGILTVLGIAIITWSILQKNNEQNREDV